MLCVLFLISLFIIVGIFYQLENLIQSHFNVPMFTLFFSLILVNMFLNVYISLLVFVYIVSSTSKKEYHCMCKNIAAKYISFFEKYNLNVVR